MGQRLVLQFDVSQKSLQRLGKRNLKSQCTVPKVISYIFAKQTDRIFGISNRLISLNILTISNDYLDNSDNMD